MGKVSWSRDWIRGEEYFKFYYFTHMEICVNLQPCQHPMFLSSLKPWGLLSFVIFAFLIELFLKDMSFRHKNMNKITLTVLITVTLGHVLSESAAVWYYGYSRNRKWYFHLHILDGYIIPSFILLLWGIWFWFTLSFTKWIYSLCVELSLYSV